jgi:hypothetical protein
VGFIEDYLETYDSAESPTSFFYWSAIAAISAVLRKNVYINKRIYKLYPNLYIMFVAKSGLRKGYPVKQCQKLVEQTEVVKVISGRNSIQSILQELSRQWTIESGKVMKDAQALIVNDELDSLLINDPQAQTILTALYDSFYHKNWTNTLKKDGREVLKDLCITLLTATNPTHLDNFLDSTSISGGFLGRTIIVYEDRKSKINALIEENDAIEVNLKPLLDKLIETSKIVGQFTFTPPAVKYYKEWYKEFYEKLQSNEIDDITGTAERAGDTALKLAMVLSVNNSPSLIIDRPHIEKSIDLFYKSARDSKLVTEGKGKSSESDKVKTVLGYLLARPDYSAYRKQILASRYGDISATELASAIDTLEQAGLVEVAHDKEEGPFYKLPDRYVEKLKGKVFQWK